MLSDRISKEEKEKQKNNNLFTFFFLFALLNGSVYKLFWYLGILQANLFHFSVNTLQYFKFWRRYFFFDLSVAYSNFLSTIFEIILTYFYQTFISKFQSLKFFFNKFFLLFNYSRFINLKNVMLLRLIILSLNIDKRTLVKKKTTNFLFSFNNVFSLNCQIFFFQFCFYYYL